MIFSLKKREKAHKYIDELFELGKEVVINIYRKQRTLSQNRLFWLWMTCIAVETGNDRNWLHDYYCQKFLPTKEEQIKTSKGVKIIYTQQGTSDLNTLNFKILLDKIKLDAEEEFTMDKEHPFVLPNPDDIHFKEFYEHYKRYLNAA
jgi:hypothetical protein